MNKKNETLTDLAYTEIRELILTGQLKPQELITENSLQQRLNLGRTPIREAILRLANKKLIIIHPRKGIEVAPITVKMIHDIFQVRLMFEPNALKYSAPNLSKEWLREMLDRFYEYQSRNILTDSKIVLEYVKLDDYFHRSLIAPLNNDYVTSLVDSYSDHFLFIRSSIVPVYYANDKTGHKEIIEALINDDIETACKTLEAHINYSYTEMIDYYVKKDLLQVSPKF